MSKTKTKISKPILILVDGASGSGKSTISEEIAKNLPNELSCIIINQDRYYRWKKNKDDVIINHDHPNAFIWNEILKHLKSLMDGKKVNLPVYDYKIHKRLEKKELTKPADVIIFEGIYALYNDEINSWASLKIFVDTSKDECFIRRLLRDTNRRGRTIESIIDQWRETVVPMYNAFIEPLKQKADIIIPWGNYNEAGISIISHSLHGLIEEKKKNELLSKNQI